MHRNDFEILENNITAATKEFYRLLELVAKEDEYKKRMDLAQQLSLVYQDVTSRLRRSLMTTVVEAGGLKDTITPAPEDVLNDRVIR